MKENNEISNFSNEVFGNSFPEKGTQEYVEVEHCKSDNSYQPPYNDRLDPMNNNSNDKDKEYSIKIPGLMETPVKKPLEMNMRCPENSRISQKHDSNGREKNSRVVMVYSTIPE